MDEKKRIGFAMCGSFCTFSKVIPQISALTQAGYDVQPIMSETAYSTDTRFGTSATFNTLIENATGKTIWHSLTDVEPVGPKKLLDLLIIAPCTGSTLSKLANGISDTSVTLCAKAHLRNERPILIGISSNDALGNNAKNIGILLNSKHIYFVPFGQDSPFKKSTSLIAKMDLIPSAAQLALNNEQLQPIIV